VEYESYRHSLRQHWLAVVTLIVTLAVIEASWWASRGYGIDAGYWVSTHTLGVLVACLGVVLVAGWSGPSMSLGLLVGLTVARDAESLLQVALLTSVTLLLARLSRVESTHPAWLALACSFAVAAALVVLPSFAQLTPDRLRVAQSLVFAATLAPALLLSRWVAGHRAFLIPMGLMACALGGLMAMNVARLPAHSIPPAQVGVTAAKASVLLVVMDTVRADHTSLYGYERDTTPRLRRFAQSNERARVYPNAWSTSTWTIPAHASLFTGELPSQVGTGGDDFRFRGLTALGEVRSRTTLALELRRSGYRNVGISANPWLNVAPGMARGFDVFFEPGRAMTSALPAERLREALPVDWRPRAPTPYAQGDATAAAVEHAVQRCQVRCFVFANFMDAHAPYVPARELMGRFDPRRFDGDSGPARKAHDATEIAILLARYDEAIRTLDAHVGGLLERLRDRGQLDDFWVIVTSDHGEAFQEHGEVAHGSTIHGEVTKVPLLVVPPRGVVLPKRDEATSLLDITATVSAALATTGRLGRGNDLREPPHADAIALSDFARSPSAVASGAGATQASQALVLGRHRLLSYQTHDALYDLQDDPKERRDIAQARPEVVSALRERLPHRTTPSIDRPATNTTTVSPAQHEQLRALGYVQ
jgi:arylsulfatase A-like enzyme